MDFRDPSLSVATGRKPSACFSFLTGIRSNLNVQRIPDGAIYVSGRFVHIDSQTQPARETIVCEVTGHFLNISPIASLRNAATPSQLGDCYPLPAIARRFAELFERARDFYEMPRVKDQGCCQCGWD